MFLIIINHINLFLPDQRLDQQPILLRQVQFIVNLNHPRYIIRKHPRLHRRRRQPPQPPRAGHGGPRRPVVPLLHLPPQLLPLLPSTVERNPVPTRPPGVAAHCHCHRCTNNRKAHDSSPSHGNLGTAATSAPSTTSRNPRRNRLPPLLNRRPSCLNSSHHRPHHSNRFEQPDLPDFVPLRWVRFISLFPAATRSRLPPCLASRCFQSRSNRIRCDLSLAPSFLPTLSTTYHFRCEHFGIDMLPKCLLTSCFISFTSSLGFFSRLSHSF